MSSHLSHDFVELTLWLIYPKSKDLCRGGGYGVERVSVKFNMVPPENRQMEKEIPAFENIMFKLHVIFLGCMTFYCTSWFRGMILTPYNTHITEALKNVRTSE